MTREDFAAAEAPALSRFQLAGIAGGSALGPLNSTMIAVALPRIADDFDISIGGSGVLVTAYLVAMLLGQPLAGRVGDAVGHRRMLRIALAGFAVMSVLCALSPEFWFLASARVGQAVFAAAIGPGVQALLRTLARPEDRGRTFGFHGSIIGIGAALGPVIGGALTEVFGWQAIFLVNLPVVGWALLSSVRSDAGGDAPRPAHEHVDATWVNPVFVACFAIQALSACGQYMLLLVTPVLLEARDWSSAAIGLALSALTIGLVVMGPIGGRAGDRRGRRWPVLVGSAAACGALVVVAGAGSTVLPAVLVAVLAVSGIGLGLSIPSVTTAGLESVDARRAGVASGVLSTARYVGSIGTSLMVAAWVADDGGGASGTLWVAAAAAAVAIGVASRLPSHG